MGSGVDFHTLLQLVTDEHARMISVAASERRIGAQARLSSVMEEFSDGLADIRRIVASDAAKLKRGTSYLVERTLQMTSTLFSAGSEPQIWRRWSSLTSLGYHLLHRRLFSAQFAALAGEWELLARIDRSAISSGDVASVVFWALIGGQVPIEPSYRDDSFDSAWRSLRQSIPRSEHEDTESALKAIADFWIGDSGGEWEEFHPREHPNFEQVVNAVAALARHHGYVPMALSSAQLRFLDAGLAPAEPISLVPNVVSI
jgi:uncharacterized protein YukE